MPMRLNEPAGFLGAKGEEATNDRLIVAPEMNVLTTSADFIKRSKGQCQRLLTLLGRSWSCEVGLTVTVFGDTGTATEPSAQWEPVGDAVAGLRARLGHLAAPRSCSTLREFSKLGCSERRKRRSHKADWRLRCSC